MLSLLMCSELVTWSLFLSDVLHAIITMSLKLKEKINSPPLVLNVLTKDELGFDLESGFGYEHQEGSM